MRVLLALLLTVFASAASAAEPAVFTKNRVTVAVVVERAAEGTGAQATIVATFTPDPTYPKPLHLYGIDLPAGGVGIATQVGLPPGSPLSASGPLTADKPTHVRDGLAVYPDGPITLRLPVRLPVRVAKDDDSPLATTVLVSYLACTADNCLIPVVNGKILISVPTVPEAQAVIAPVVQSIPQASQLAAAEVRQIVAEELDHRLPAASGEIAWRTPTTVAAVEALIANATGPVLLDFTGPSCLNCQVMEKTVFRTAEVRAALRRVTAVKINTDPPNDEMADWQQKRFQSQERPLYVLITGGAQEHRWSAVFAPSDSRQLAAFVAFIAGGQGVDGQGSGGFWWLAILGGLVTLLMPCTYPMIPFTVNFFAKQAGEGRKLLPLALFYGAGIVGCFIGLGVLITGVLGANLASLAGHPITNLIIALVFILFGLSLLGVFLLQIPLLGGGRGGYLGALLMGLTFAVTAFSCTAPFAGSVLAAAVATGSWTRAISGMAVYSLAIAIPFVLLALSPGALRKIPKAGAWMNELKVVGGLIELAAALKFLVIADHAWGWGLFGRTVTLVGWSATSLLIACYLLGLIRWDSDDRITTVGPTRLLLAIVFLSLGLWFFSGLTGSELGRVEGLFPGE